MVVSSANVHPPAILIAGDDWSLPGVMKTADGQVMSLLNKTLEWCLYDKDALNRVISNDNMTIEIVDSPNGTVIIHVPKGVTERLNPGRYEDSIRYRDSVTGYVDTLWTGIIHVKKTGFVSLNDEGQFLTAAQLSANSTMMADGIVV